MTAQLRPSRELLEFYRKKIAEYNEEHCSVLSHLDRYRDTCDTTTKLQWELRQREGEIAELQNALSDMQQYLYQEKEHLLRLYAENDRLKLRELEDKHKIQHLLTLGGAPAGEVTYFHKEPPAMAVTEQNYSDSIGAITASSSVDSCRHDNKILSMQIERLQTQLQEQTCNSQERLASLEADRQDRMAEEEARRKRDKEKVEALVERLHKSQELLYDTTKQLLQQRYQLRTTEKAWMAERDSLLLQLDRHAHCYCNTNNNNNNNNNNNTNTAPHHHHHHHHHRRHCSKGGGGGGRGGRLPVARGNSGSSSSMAMVATVGVGKGLSSSSCHCPAAPTRGGGGGGVCNGVCAARDEREEERLAEDREMELVEQIQNLRYELHQSQTMSAMYQSQAIEGEEELCKIREEGDFARESFKERSDKMCKRLQLMNTRYEELERRRHFEVEGFRNDIKGLRTKLRAVERELYKVTLGLSEELPDTKDPDHLDLRILRNVHLTAGRSQRIMAQLQQLKGKVYSLEGDLRRL